MIMIGPEEMKGEFEGWIGNDDYWCVSDAPYYFLDQVISLIIHPSKKGIQLRFQFVVEGSRIKLATFGEETNHVMVVIIGTLSYQTVIILMSMIKEKLPEEAPNE